MITQDIQSETGALLASLTIQRNHVLGILEGLSDDQLRRPVLPSGWSCLGMVQHLTISDERFWFRGIVGGDSACVSASADEAKAEAIWQVARTRRLRPCWRPTGRRFELADAVIAATPLDQPPAVWPAEIWPDWRLPNLRAVILHVITETACHTGHLDAARELIDSHQWMT